MNKEPVSYAFALGYLESILKYILKDIKTGNTQISKSAIITKESIEKAIAISFKSEPGY